MDPSQIRDVFESIAHEAFPDDVDVRWHIRAIVQKSAFYGVEAEPSPSTVGYPLFRFVLGLSTSGEFRDHACFCLDAGTWRLLYTTPGTSDEWRTLHFDRSD